MKGKEKHFDNKLQQRVQLTFQYRELLPSVILIVFLSLWQVDALPILADRGVRAGTIPKKGKKLGYFYKVSFSYSMLKGKENIAEKSERKKIGE